MNDPVSRERYRQVTKEFNDSGGDKLWRDVFNKFDQDGSGEVDAKELRKILADLGQRVTASDAEAMVKEADVDGSGRWAAARNSTRTSSAGNTAPNQHLTHN